jgi:Cu(I)/Ag(I) efflux system membrane protein CusA/SilA
MPELKEEQDFKKKSLLDKIIYFCLNNKLVVTLIVLLILFWGVMVAPFDWNLGGVPRDPLLGVPGVKTVRSYSMFGFSSIYVIFKEKIDFYWSRSRILEKLNSLPAGTLPEDVQPILGPDATALGQIYWYTLEGRDEKGNPTGGWDLHELRTVQDWYVRYALLSADGISEVASVGGFVQEYQVDVDPDAMRAYNVSLDQVFMAVKMSNMDVGARTIEINKVEYVIRGIGFIKKIEDIENSVVKVNNNVPIYIKNIGKVNLGPALRRGALDKEGTEVVGGVVVVRYGDNPLAAIKNLKKKIEEISPGLPKKNLADGRTSQVCHPKHILHILFNLLDMRNKEYLPELLR